MAHKRLHKEDGIFRQFASRNWSLSKDQRLQDSGNFINRIARYLASPNSVYLLAITGRGLENPALYVVFLSHSLTLRSSFITRSILTVYIAIETHWVGHRQLK
jgi:hypothetical protein